MLVTQSGNGLAGIRLLSSYSVWTTLGIIGLRLILGGWAQMLGIVNRKSLTATTLLLLLCSCGPPTQRQPQAQQQTEEPAPFRAPSASELFDLQSKCTAMGEKLMKDNFIGDTLTQDQVSHYNPKDNRCYVKLTVSPADSTRQDIGWNYYLYDGQSKETLAYAIYKGETKTGMVNDSSLLKIMQKKKQSETDAAAISELIDSFVTTDRRP